MSAEMKELLAFVSTSVIGFAATGFMLGDAFIAGKPGWTIIAALAVIGMAVTLYCSIRWLSTRRRWETQEFTPVAEGARD